jgi:hypothetical protein
MSLGPIEPAKDPRSFEHKNPVKGPLQRAYKNAGKKRTKSSGNELDEVTGPVNTKGFDAKSPALPPSEEKVGKTNPRSPRSPEDHDKASDLYKKAREEHSAKTEEEYQSTRGYDEEEHYGGGGGVDLDLGGSGAESEKMAYSRFYGGPHSMFQVRKEQPQYKSPEEE